MYTQSDLTAIKAQQKKRWLVFAIPGGMMLIGLIVSLILRIELLTTGLTILLGAALILFYDLMIKPLRRYQHFLEDGLTGLTRTTECIFQAVTKGSEPVDGVECRTMTVIDHTDEGRPYERIFYCDVLKPFPELTEGTPICVRYHDRYMVDIQCI